MKVYDSMNRKFDDDDFYCGLSINKLASCLKRLKDGDISLQAAYDKIVNDIIIKHVIKNSDCECRDYLHEMEEFINKIKYTKIESNLG